MSLQNDCGGGYVKFGKLLFNYETMFRVANDNKFYIPA